MNIQIYLIDNPPYKTYQNLNLSIIINISEQHINLLHNFIIHKIYELKLITSKYICIKYLHIPQIFIAIIAFYRLRKTQKSLFLRVEQIRIKQVIKYINRYKSIHILRN